MVLLLLAGSVGFALMAVDAVAPFVVGALVGFMLGWGWPGLFNLSVVQSHRETPGAATGVSQSGIYVGAAGGPPASVRSIRTTATTRPGSWWRRARCSRRA